MSSRPFSVLGVQQIAVGGPDKQALRRLWIDTLGLTQTGTFRSEAENVDEDIAVAGSGPLKVEVDLMQPLDPEKRPKVHEPPQRLLVRAADGDLLHAQYREWSRRHESSGNTDGNKWPQMNTDGQTGPIHRCSSVSIRLSSVSPEQQPLERIEVRTCVFQLRQQPLAVARQELRPQVGGQALLVGGEQGAAHPLDHLVAGGEEVGVHL